MKQYDPEKRRQYHLTNKERDNAYCRNYLKTHKEQRKKYLLEHKEEFAQQRKKRHEINKERDNERARQQWKEFIDKWFKDKSCSLCGKSEDLVFHHIDPATKDTDVTRLKRKSDEIIQKEIEKCVVLCRSCHMKVHDPHKWRDLT